MVVLWSFGSSIFQELGREQFLAVYTSAAVLASLASHLWTVGSSPPPPPPPPPHPSQFLPLPLLLLHAVMRLPGQAPLRMGVHQLQHFQSPVSNDAVMHNIAMITRRPHPSIRRFRRAAASLGASRIAGSHMAQESVPWGTGCVRLGRPACPSRQVFSIQWLFEDTISQYFVSSGWYLTQDTTQTLFLPQNTTLTAPEQNAGLVHASWRGIGTMCC